MIQNKMAGIINRTKERGDRNGLTTEEKQIYNEVYSELVEDYLGRAPEFTDVEHLVNNLITVFVVGNKKEAIKLQAVVEIYKNFIE